MTLLNPYIGFKDKARAAMEFYHSVFGGKLEISTFGEAHMAHTPEDNDKVMHGMLTTDKGLVLMASDAASDMPISEGSSISISLSGEDETELRGYWNKLTEGGNITMPLEKAPWGDTFGMLTDKFGINWMVNVTGPKV